MNTENKKSGFEHTISENAKAWLAASPADFEQLVEGAGTLADARALATELEYLACRAAIASEYLSTRFGLDGTGRHDHKDGARAVNRAWKLVRSVFGYTKSAQKNIL